MLTDVAGCATVRDMNRNTELEKLRRRTTIHGLIAVLGRHKTNVYKQLRRGYLTQDAAFAVVKAWPDLDLAKLLQKPKG